MRPGERIVGRFEILGEAGRGGMGTVFRARDRRAHRDVALKVLAPGALPDAPRFEREATLLAGVRHANIVEYVSHGATPDGIRYLVMEWVDGTTLADTLTDSGLAPRDTLRIAIQLAHALDALHAQNVVHRDVKPSNVMLAGATVKLVDLGVARPLSGPSALTRTGAGVGTAGYMAPEQARGLRDDIDTRADLFALGCVLYECLTGARAFPAEDLIAARAKVLLHDPPPLRQLAPTLPPALEQLLTSLLAKNPDDRPATAATVAAALTALTNIDGDVVRAAPVLTPTLGRTVPS